MSISIIDSFEEQAEVYDLTAIHADLKLGSNKHPALFESDSTFHYFNDCGRLNSSLEGTRGLVHWGDEECLEAFSRWLGYGSLDGLLDAVIDSQQSTTNTDNK